MTSQVTAVNAAGAVFFIVAIVVYLLILKLQHGNLSSGSYNLSVISTRLAMVLPLYAFFIFIALVAPASYVVMIIFVTLIEGYSLYCFTYLIVTNLGGPAKAVKLMQEEQNKLCCPCTGCCPTDRERFYIRLKWCMYHMVYTRTILSIIAAVCFYSGSTAGHALYSVLSAVNAVILVWSLITLVNFCKSPGLSEYLTLVCVDCIIVLILDYDTYFFCLCTASSPVV